MSRLQSSSTPAGLRRRAALCGEIRGFFAARGVLEVQTPLLSPYAVTDVHIESWRTTEPVRYLRTSPEYAMKKLLAAGSGDIYELGPVFRHGEQGEWHSPEFTMLEWYRLGWSYRELAEEVVALLQTVAGGALAGWPVKRISYREAARTPGGIDLLGASTGVLKQAALDAGLARPEALHHAQLLDFLFSALVQKRLDPHTLHVIHDYPASQAALARIDRNGPHPVAQRFEVFAGPVELANGYQELTDAAEQRQRFEADNQVRSNTGQRRMPVDTELLDALASGLPECAGVALGVDRLYQVLESTTDWS